MDTNTTELNARGFRYLLRVRYSECDAQRVVFNARYGDYIDIAVSELVRLIWGGIRELLDAGIDYQLVKQTIEWKSGARVDEVLTVSVAARRIGTTSFTIGVRFSSFDDERLIATAETTYVLMDATTLHKRPIPDEYRRRLEAGPGDVVVDHAGAGGIRPRTTSAAIK